MDPQLKIRYPYIVWDDQQIKGFFGFGEDEYGFLSNFYPAPTEYDGVIYPTSEHAYMASKTLNHKERATILSAYNAAEAKKIGRTVTLRDGWDGELRDNCMYNIVLDKFTRNKDLQARLLATGSKYLEETNSWRDLHFGVDAETGKGDNMLGKILMGVRTHLKIEELA